MHHTSIIPLKQLCLVKMSPSNNGKVLKMLVKCKMFPYPSVCIDTDCSWIKLPSVWGVELLVI